MYLLEQWKVLGIPIPSYLVIVSISIWNEYQMFIFNYRSLATGHIFSLTEDEGGDDADLLIHIATRMMDLTSQLHSRPQPVTQSHQSVRKSWEGK